MHHCCGVIPCCHERHTSVERPASGPLESIYFFGRHLAALATYTFFEECEYERVKIHQVSY